MIDMLDVTTQTTVHLPGMGAFSGGWRFPTKLKTASSLPKNERLKPENGGVSLEKDILFGIHLSSSRLVFRACTIFVFDSNSMEVTEKKHTKKQLLWKKRSQNFDVSVVWGWCGMRCSCFRYQLKYGLKNVAMFLVGSLSFRESWGQKIMKTRRYYFPNGSPWPGCCWQLNTFLLVWLVLTSSNLNIVYFSENFGGSHGVMLPASDHETKVLVQIRWLKMVNFWLRNSERIFVFAWSRPQMAIWKLFFRDRVLPEVRTSNPFLTGETKNTTTFGMFTTFFSPFWNFQGYITRALNQGNKKHRKERIFMMLKTSPTT